MAVSVYDNVYRYIVRPLRTRKVAPSLTRRVRRTQQALESANLDELVSRRLNSLVQHAATNIPFWRRRFADAGIDPRQVATLGDLRRLPLLEKSEVRERLSELVSPDESHPLPDMTGGSTAAPMRFFRDATCLAERVANEWVFFAWYGRRPHDRWGHIWGSQRDLGETASFKARLRSRLYERSIALPANKLSPELIDEFLASMRRFRPRFLHAYSQGVYLVARHVLDSGQSAPAVEVTTVTAEPISELQRETINRAFGCRTYAIYGTREFGMIAAESPHEEGLQINPLNALVEILKPDGSPAEPGDSGQVVVTDLLNRAMPLIRYRIGDVAAPLPAGRLGLPRMELVAGRETDFVIMPDGRYVSGAALTLITAPGVAQLQFVQQAEKQLTVCYVPTAAFGDAALLELQRRVIDVLGPELNYVFDRVNEIPLLPSGKLQYVRSDVARKRLAVASVQ